ncbi:hypothetical protein [Polaribacter aestuariivivens]|uniref:hypothetical protein n=1 Tax=Polaribacter aestuariivivens TaxID=2304626 RepID=UPI003F4910C1
MKTNNIDKNVKEKLANRVFQPSASAWERLSTQLDEQPKQKKKAWFFYIGYAASILALISVGIYLFSNDDKMVSPKQIIVEESIDTTTINNKIDEIFNEIPVEKAIVKNENTEEKQLNKEVKINKRVISKDKTSSKNTIAKNEILNQEVLKEVKNLDESLLEQEKPIKKINNSSIKVNSEDLLYAVTHSESEVKKYYAKNDITREEVLKTIQIELKKSNLKVDPETILAEVESTISDDVFQNNFLKSLKRRVTDIASAIASRND